MPDIPAPTQPREAAVSDHEKIVEMGPKADRSPFSGSEQLSAGESPDRWTRVSTTFQAGAARSPLTLGTPLLAFSTNMRGISCTRAIVRAPRNWWINEMPDGSKQQRQPRRAASIAATSIFFIPIITSNARFASSPPAASTSVSTRGVICQETPHLSLHQPHALSCPPLPTMAFQ